MTSLTKKLGGVRLGRMPLGGDRLTGLVTAGGNLLLVVAMAYGVSGIIWTWAGPSAGNATPSPAPVRAMADGPSTSALDYDPFHRMAAVAASPAAAAHAPETTLDLTLYGIRSGKGEEAGSAIIGLPDNRQSAFRVGAEIMNGVTLKAVMADRVILSHRGAREALYLDPDKERRSTLTVAAPTTGQSAGMAGDMQLLMQAVEFEPRFSGGRLDGIHLNPGEDRAAFARFGLRPGDVLVAVNGNRITSLEKAKKLESDLRHAKSVRLEIERGGETRTVEIPQRD